MNYLAEYDKSNPISIENYAQKLIGMTFQEVIEQAEDYSNFLLEGNILTESISEKREKNKGNLGQIVEYNHFHYKCNNDSDPDFKEAGVELKVTPYKINPGGKKVAKERLILTMIDYCEVVNEEFETSHLWKKCKLLLIVYYLYQKEIEDRLDYRIDYVKLFTPPKEDLEIIKHDFNVIVGKIRDGKAHELSEGDTMYLGAATKSATSENRRKQPFSDENAKPRAFSFKNSYMTYVLNNYIVPSKVKYESILKNKEFTSFEEFVMKKINSYNGYTIEKLSEKFEVNLDKKPKNLEAMLTYRILGIKGNAAEEFVKANIVIKTIRVGSNNKIKESMSFPNFKFMDLIQEEWETSSLATYLEETRFLFVVYKYDIYGNLVLKGCQFWNIPYNDLHEEVCKVWNRTVRLIQEGVKITVQSGVKRNNLPGSSENKVCHVRPHGINAADTYPLPDGRQLTKQCFWLNNSYILSQLDKRFLE